MYAPGVTLGDRYRLEERIGGGGMGEVWRGTDQVLGRTVAVKLMLPSLVREPGFAQRFLSEARAMASINHAGVVDIHDYRSDESGSFLVMEYVAGESLSQALHRQGRLSPTRTMEVIAQAAEALQAVHAKGIVHRDIKPGNLMVRDDGAVVLTDFGIARSQAASQLTATGAVIGTAPYVSPEQALGRPATPVSDLYALGVVAYQCLSGQPPFDGDSPIAVVMKHVRDEPPTLPPEVPPAVRAVVLRSLAKDPAHRWPSAAELAAAARRATDPTAAAPPAALRPAPPPGPTGARPPVSPGGAPPPVGPGGTRPLSATAGRAQPVPPAPTPPRRTQPTPPRSQPAPRGGTRPWPAPPPPARRTAPPATVTIAALLLLVAAASFGVYFLAALSVYEDLTRTYQRADAGSDLGRFGPPLVGAHVAVAATLLLVGFLLLLLAWRNYRGGRAARGWTVTFSLLVLCCCGGGLLAERGGAEQFGSSDTNQRVADVQDRLAAVLPPWYGPVTSTTVLLGLAALLVATVLLTAPPSSRYFRNPMPPYPYYPYPPR